MGKLAAGIVAAFVLLIGVPLMGTALIVTGSTATAMQLETCAGGGASVAGEWRPPYEHAYVVGRRGFGMRFHPIFRIWRAHTGQDMTSIPTGGPIVASAAGTVTFAGDSGSGYGNLVTIDHGGGIETAYAHLARIDPAITVGATVSIGQRLGIEGSTGNSTGNHLHYEVRRGGTAIDPVPFMAENGAPLDGRAIAPSTPPTKDADQSANVPISAGSFELPPPAEPRLNSLTNPALPIPPEVKALYVAAAEEYDLPWTLLAGIGMAETAHGRIRATSSAGAQGLMQFMPATWAIYGVDGDGDGRADILNDADSTMSAANYLTASGVHNGPDGVRDALFAYNRAHWYVNDVLHYAHTYGGGELSLSASNCPAQ